MGLTFKYTETVPIGLISNKEVVVIAARGRKHRGTELDTQTKYLTNFLAFAVMTEVEVYYLEGLAMSEERAKTAWEIFFEEISEPKLVLED